MVHLPDIVLQAFMCLSILGITDAVNQEELVGIASSSPGIDFVFNAEDFDALENIRQLVVTAACQAASGM